MTKPLLSRHGRLHRVLASTLFLAACADPQGADDASPNRPISASPVAAAMQLGMTPVALDDRGLPRLMQAARVPAAPAATATESAIAHLSRLSPAWGVARTAVPQLQGVGEVPASGATIARVRQTIDGLPVDGGEVRVMVREGGELVATNGALVSADTPRLKASFSIDDAGAVARAVAHNYKRDFAPSVLAQKELRSDGTRLIRGSYGGIDVQMARAKQAWHNSGAMLIPVWIVEAYAGDASSTNGDAFRTTLTADGSRVISHHSLVADVAFNYRVFANPDFSPMDGPIADFSPHPTGTPNGAFPALAAPVLVAVDGLNTPAGSATPDPWLPSTRTETFGNNVEAYTDISPPTGFTFGDFRATTTATRTFDRTYNLTQNPLQSQGQQMASITSAFYGINWLHDFWYDAGFTEAAGNAQDNNYGRGGEDRDAMLAETQDNALGGSINNANMSTPSDGLQPRMQIFVWSGKEVRTLTILPANRKPATGTAAFGPVSFNVTGELALAVDGADAPNDGCTALTNNVTGKIVIVDRGGCTFKTKALNIQNAGGLGVILANNAAGTVPPGLADDATITTPITIGTLSVTQAEGAQIKTELTAGVVNVTLLRNVGPQLDGGLDSTLLAHEFGHYLHHRLQDCVSAWCSAQSEGWGDFLALMLMVREGDNYNGAYPFSIYTTQSFTSDPAYFGIRRAPFSADPAINSLSYRHMADGEPLPTTHPFLVFGNNAEVHNAGEVWTQALWEVYSSLLKVPNANFAATRAKMAKYVVSGLLMSPQNATPTETRDAILAVASAEDRPIMLEAFARRGMGSCAITPARDSSTFIGIQESTVVAGRAAVGALAFAEGESCDDDEVLDAGETATISLPLANDGHVELKNVKVTVTSMTPGVSIATQPVSIATFPAGMTQELVFDVALDKGATGPISGEFALKIETENGCTNELTMQHKTRLNVDDLPETSATDSVDAKSPWTPTGTTEPLWAQTNDTDGLDRQWHGTDFGGIADSKLESPELRVGTTAPFKVTFSHRYSFEFSDDLAWDGGVIEYSTDNGVNWTDVATLPGVSPGYTHVLTDLSGNPLGGRQGFGDKSPGYPAAASLTLDFGTQLAGMSVKLRFRIGSDVVIGAEGWDIDDIKVEGITNTPFATQVEDKSADCGVAPTPPPLPPVDEQPGGCCDAGPIRGSNMLLVLGILGLLLRRRRR